MPCFCNLFSSICLLCVCFTYSVSVLPTLCLFYLLCVCITDSVSVLPTLCESNLLYHIYPVPVLTTLCLSYLLCVCLTYYMSVLHTLCLSYLLFVNIICSVLTVSQRLYHGVQTGGIMKTGWNWDHVKQPCNAMPLILENSYMMSHQT